MLTLVLILAVFCLAPLVPAIFSETAAATIGAYYLWRSDRLTRELLITRHDKATGDSASLWHRDRRQQQLLAQHLRHAIRMTALFSQFPQSAMRGHVIMRLLGGVA